METALRELATAATALLPVNCDGLHHAKADRHEGSTSCPVVARGLAALATARRALGGRQVKINLPGVLRAMAKAEDRVEMVAEDPSVIDYCANAADTLDTNDAEIASLRAALEEAQLKLDAAREVARARGDSVAALLNVLDYLGGDVDGWHYAREVLDRMEAAERELAALKAQGACETCASHVADKAYPRRSLFATGTGRLHRRPVGALPYSRQPLWPLDARRAHAGFSKGEPMIDYAKVKRGDIVRVVGVGAPGYATLGDLLRIVEVHTNGVLVEDKRGQPCEFVYNCGAARLEPTEWTADFPAPPAQSVAPTPEG